MKELKLENVVRQAVMLKVERRKYLIYVTKEDNCDIIKIVSLYDFCSENSQVLLKFKNSVFLNIACDGKYLYVAKRNLERKLEKYRIYENDNKFLLCKEKEIELPNKNMQIQCITSSENGKIAIFDMKEGFVYEIVDDELKFIRCVKQLDPKLYYNNEDLYCTCDTQICDYTKSMLVKYQYHIGSKDIRSIYYSANTCETIFGIGKAAIFEKDSSFNGMIFLEEKEITDINMYDDKLILCCYDNKNGYIIILNPKDVKYNKENFIKSMKELKRKKQEIMLMISKCSAGDENVFYNLAKEFKYRGIEMYKDMKIIDKEHLFEKEAFNRYIECKNS